MEFCDQGVERKLFLPDRESVIINFCKGQGAEFHNLLHSLI